MNINIYDFLKKDYEDIYNLGNEIDKSVFESPHSVIVKSRVFTEQLIKEIATLEDVNNVFGRNAKKIVRGKTQGAQGY